MECWGFYIGIRGRRVLEVDSVVWELGNNNNKVFLRIMFVLDFIKIFGDIVIILFFRWKN